MNKVIVITGGANGIGFNTAVKFLAEGAKTVVLLDIDEEQGNAAVNELNKTHGSGKASFILCDVTTDVETVGDSILASYKTVDALVNCAGIGDETMPKKAIDINTTAVILLSLKFYEHMRKDKGGTGGTIINISSILGLRITYLAPVYCASKFAVVAFTRSLGHEVNVKKTGVRVVALCPGFTKTRLTEPLLDEDNKAGLSEELVTFARQCPWQSVDAVGEAAVNVFKTANSGSVWLIEGAKPIEEVP